MSMIHQSVSCVQPKFLTLLCVAAVAALELLSAAQAAPSTARFVNGTSIPLNEEVMIDAIGGEGFRSPDMQRAYRQDHFLSPLMRPGDTVTPGDSLRLSAQFIWPAEGVITSGFGTRWGRMHNGIDIAAPIGTPIVAAASGVVTYAGWDDGGYGNLVEIQHSDGSITRYAHNQRVLVQVGQNLAQGQMIAEMGSTGRSTGPHCHFEIRSASRSAVNPIAYLPSR